MTIALDRALGCLLGGALGDALGAPIEFTSGDEIARRHGAAAPRALAFAAPPPAEITDDTQMTLFVAEGLIRAIQRQRDRGQASPQAVIRAALLRWYETQGGMVPPSPSARGWLVAEPRLHARRAPGNTCLSALAALARDPQLHPSPARPPNDSKGCGAVMRAAPLGLAPASREQAFELGRDTGALTHGHPSGHLSSAYLAALIWGVARGETLPAAMTRADALLAREPGREEMAAILARARDLAARGAPDRAAVESLGGGWTGEEALAIGLVCALTLDEPGPDGVARALWRAAAHGGDSDSTASIAGNLLGAQLGAAALPAAWLAQLELRDVIERVARDLHAVAEGRRVSVDDYPPN